MVFVEVEVVGCIHGCLEYASVMSSQFVPMKLMAWSICTLLHGLLRASKDGLGLWLAASDFQHMWGIDGIGPQCPSQTWANRLQLLRALCAKMA